MRAMPRVYRRKEGQGNGQVQGKSCGMHTIDNKGLSRKSQESLECDCTSKLPGKRLTGWKFLLY